MPELPEVETVCRGLSAALTGQTFSRVTLRREGLRQPFPPGFAERLGGRKVTSITRRAKYWRIHLSDGLTLLGHLGMSGRMVIGQSKDAPPPDKHDHVLFETDNGVLVRYHDPRRFGMMDLVDTDKLDQHRWLRALGPEPLEPATTAQHLLIALQGRSTAIKVALLDQSVIAGIGNIYASEALFRAGINPTRPAGEISAGEMAFLLKAIRAVLSEAIASGGSSLRDHRQPSGELGYFQHHFAVYDREGETCPGCGLIGGIRRIVQGGRATFYCPDCQPL